MLQGYALQRAILDKVQTRTAYRLLTQSGYPGATEPIITYVTMSWDEWVDLISKTDLLND